AATMAATVVRRVIGWDERRGKADDSMGYEDGASKPRPLRFLQRARYWSFSLTSFHSSASSGAGFRSMIGFQTLESSAFSAVNCCCSAGTSSSAKIASTGHSATHNVQSMHSSGSITRKLEPSRKQSTGQTSTQSVYLQRIQLSVTT